MLSPAAFPATSSRRRKVTFMELPREMISESKLPGTAAERRLGTSKKATSTLSDRYDETLVESFLGEYLPQVTGRPIELVGMLLFNDAG